MSGEGGEGTKGGTTVSDITRTYFPSAKLAGLLVATLLLGMWIQRQVLSPIADSQNEKAKIEEEQQSFGEQLRRMENDLQTIKQSLGGIPSLEARIIAMEKAEVDKKIEDRLWKDAVWGRVSELPYKVPVDRQSSWKP